MRIVICDDDQNITERIKNIVTDFFRERKLPTPTIDIFYSGDSLLKDTRKKDIVFLDIEMPGIDGLCTGKSLLSLDKNTILIIVTSYSEYLDDAMRLNVFRYISKPIDSKRLKRNLIDAIGAYNTRKAKPIVVESAKGVIKYKSSEIIMFEMIGRKVTIYTEAGTSVTDKTLKEWLNILPESLFYHCHRSFIVNISHIKKILPDKIVMDKDDLEAYLTKRKHTEIKKIWMLYMESSN